MAFGLVAAGMVGLLGVEPAMAQNRLRADAPGSDRIGGVDIAYPFAINLESASRPIDLSALPRLPEFRNFRAYATTFESGGVTWHRLRVGFFSTQQGAERVAESLRARYPRAWVTRASESERQAAAKDGIGMAVAGAPTRIQLVPRPEKSAPTPIAPAPAKPPTPTPVQLSVQPPPAKPTPPPPAQPAAQPPLVKPVGAVSPSEMTPEGTKALVQVQLRTDAPGGDSIGNVDIANPFAINLESSTRPIDLSALPRLPEFRNYRAYTTTFESGGVTWYRLRFGFFPTQQAAERVAESLRFRYPRAWIARVSESERIAAAKDGFGAAVAGASTRTQPAPRLEKSAPPPIALAPARPPTPTPAQPSVQPPPAKPTAPPSARPAAQPLPAKPVGPVSPDEMMQEGAKAMTAGEFSRAVQLYTLVLQTGRPQDRQQAQEFLGLARERNGQIAHARAEYEEYLRLYPQGENAERVRQRLAGVLTAEARPPEKLRRAETAQKEWNWGLTGSFSQFYDRHESITAIEGRQTDQSALDNFLDMNLRGGDDRSTTNLRASGSYNQDFLENSTNVSRLAALYGDVLSRDLDLYGRVGRQFRATGGVLGRFDGGHLRYDVMPDLKLNAVAGFPVKRTRDVFVNDDSHFYGASVDLGTYDDTWDGNIFAIQQISNDLIDRRGVGGEVRYFHPDRNALALVDYDIYYGELNTALFSGTWIFPDQSTLGLAADYRRSPVLSITDALIGQPAGTVTDLLQTFTAEELRQLALDRNAISRSVTLSGSHPINETFQISADVTASKVSGTIPSGGVEGFPGTDLEMYYSLQFIGTSLLKTGDVGIIGLRYADSTSFDRYTIQLNTRYPIDREIRVSPRLRLDYRKNKETDGHAIAAIPSLRLNYIWNADLQFELEFGGEFTRSENAGVIDTTYGYFVFVGYRYDF